MSSIAAVELFRVTQPLTQPYHLAFGSFEAFDTFLLRVQTEDGREGWGEATACAGYVPETGDDIWSLLAATGPTLLGATPDAAIAATLPLASHHAYPATPLLTALEMLQWNDAIIPTSESSPETAVPLVGILSDEQEERLEAGFWTQVERGHTTIKIKVGFDVGRDTRRVLFVQRLARQAPAIRIRIDANQGYTLDEAREFVSAVSPEGVELFEQPFPPDDWESQVALSRVSPLPLMLDEAIRGPADVERAATLGCAQFVKFKLMKAGSMQLLAELIALARRLGLKVVLGNGVAGELGCYHEALAAARAGLETAGEMNGFLKLQRPLLQEPLPTVPGGMLVRTGFRPAPDLERLEEMAADRRCWTA